MNYDTSCEASATAARVAGVAASTPWLRWWGMPWLLKDLQPKDLPCILGCSVLHLLVPMCHLEVASIPSAQKVRAAMSFIAVRIVAAHKAHAMIGWRGLPSQALLKTFAVRLQGKCIK